MRFRRAKELSLPGLAWRGGDAAALDRLFPLVKAKAWLAESLRS